jgi:predicted choloylglycine hydrolase
MAVYIGKFLTHGIIPMAPSKEPEQEPFGCSSLVQRTESGICMGRNFDYEHHGQTMITRTYPKDGYASIATNSILFLGYGNTWQPADNFVMRMPAVAAIYVPLDGMNECGLCVADLIEIDGEAVHQTTGKTPITTVAAIRLMLDYAANVEEAITLLQQYDMYSSMNVAHHFALCDTTGRNVVVEYVENQMVITESIACTNHRMASRSASIDSELQPAITNSNQRLKQLLATQDYHEPLLNSIQQVAFEGWTRWSVIFNPSQKQATYYFNADFATPYTIQL